MNPRPLPAEGSQSAFALSLAIGLLAFATPALAQIPAPGIIFNPNQFSSCLTLVDFESYTVGTQFSSAPGVTFSLSDGSSPWSESISNMRQFPLVSPVQGPLVLQNFEPGSSVSVVAPDLIMDFGSPINRVGFEIIQIDGTITLTLRCFCAGSLIGTQTFTANDLKFHFLGLSSSSVFDRVEVGISNSGGGGNHRFWMDNLRFEGPPVVTIATAPGTVFQTSTAFLDFDVAHLCATTVTSLPVGLNLSLPAGSSALSLQPIPMVEGPNTLTVTATDADGNTGGASVEVISDTLAPVVTFLLPAGSGDRLVVGGTPVDVSVQVQDATSTTVFYGGGEFSRFGGTHLFTASFSLSEGSQFRNITVIDKAFHETLGTVELVLDSAAPLVTINTPADGSIFGTGLAGGVLPMTATVNDLTATTVSSVPAGLSATLLPGGGMVSGSVVLSEGLNPLVVTAEDEAGHLGSSPPIFVILDTTPPTALVATPGDGDHINGVIDFDALVSDVAPGTGIAQVEFSVDGIPSSPPIMAPPFGTILDTTSLSEGTHFLSVLATDVAGNSSSDTITVTVDRTAPLITILEPLGGETVDETVFFDAVVSSAGAGVRGVRMRVDGAAPNIVDGSLAFAVPVGSAAVSSLDDTVIRMDGSVLFRVAAVDAAGNESSQEVSVIVDNTKHGRCIKRPENGKRVKHLLVIEVERQFSDSKSLEVLVDGVSLGEVFAKKHKWFYETRTRLDGSLAITAIERGPANGHARPERVACTVRVIVDNVKFNIEPKGINLAKESDKAVIAVLRGENLELVQPLAEHSIQLLVPGVPPVTAVSLTTGSDGDAVFLEFDRDDVIEAYKAALAGGHIALEVDFFVSLMVDGHEMGTRRVVVSDRL